MACPANIFSMEIDTGEKVIEAEVANTVLKRAKGLALKDSGKMLFQFNRDTNASIDMMLLSEPLYLYFMNSDKEVIDVQKAEPWTTNPKTWKLYSPDRLYRYLLESFEKLEIEEGQQLEFDL
ncbi:hypothetical protein GKQ38_05300 [Candidatus Nanohaloarchaea archaeon]|nr:hypothetical protein GKQ38_05300 [Candidatus Nanohaloarchaea archaeon]